MKISCTIMLQKWIYDGKEHLRKTIYPWGMKKFGIKALSSEKCYSAYDVIPVDVKRSLFGGAQKMSSENYKKVKPAIRIEVGWEDENMRPKEEYAMLYCMPCFSINSDLGEMFKKKKGIIESRGCKETVMI